MVDPKGSLLELHGHFAVPVDAIVLGKDSTYLIDHQAVIHRCANAPGRMGAGGYSPGSGLVMVIQAAAGHLRPPAKLIHCYFILIQFDHLLAF